MASRESKRLRVAHLAPDCRPPRSGLVAGCEAADASAEPIGEPRTRPTAAPDALPAKPAIDPA